MVVAVGAVAAVDVVVVDTCNNTTFRYAKVHIISSLFPIFSAIPLI